MQVAACIFYARIMEENNKITDLGPYEYTNPERETDAHHREGRKHADLAHS
jgi:hypothetical protein